MSIDLRKVSLRMKFMKFQDIRDNGLLLYEYIRGSKAHGIDTPESDTDTGGVFMCPPESLLGLKSGYQEQIQSEKSDDVWYELDKYFGLVLKSNPTMLESLFIPEKWILYESPLFHRIKEHRDKFITKRCFAPFGGYAVSQIHKARSLGKKISMPLVERKTPLDFTYTFLNQGSQPILSWLRGYGLKLEFCGLNKIPHMNDMYGLYYDWGKHLDMFPEDEEILKKSKKILSPEDSWGILHYRGLVTEDISNTTQLRLSSIDDKHSKPLCHVSFNSNGFQKHCREYKEYKEWEKERNPIRYKSNLEKSYDSKNMCECFRIMQMCIEIAKGQGVLVDRRDIDRDFLLSVKAHKYEYSEILEILDKKKIEMDEAIKASTIPEAPDKEFFSDLLLDIRKEQMKKWLTL